MWKCIYIRFVPAGPLHPAAGNEWQSLFQHWLPPSSVTEMFLENVLNFQPILPPKRRQSILWDNISFDALHFILPSNVKYNLHPILTHFRPFSIDKGKEWKLTQSWGRRDCGQLYSPSSSGQSLHLIICPPTPRVLYSPSRALPFQSLELIMCLPPPHVL